MTYLLDTAPLLWAVLSPEKLSKPARQALETNRNELVVSVVSLWEVVIKAEKGSLPISDPPHWLERAVGELHGRILPVHAAHIYQLHTLPSLHRDPFDRLLVAQAAVEGWTLITSDSALRAYPVSTLW
ncbi:MAG TPA: type II toxin-antitoxin system VapC family toxin [Bryobacteraceae bacterium]